jgi:cytochrome c553
MAGWIFARWRRNLCPEPARGPHPTVLETTDSKQKQQQEQQKANMKKLVVVSLALLVAGAVTLRAAEAKENYEKNCLKCHGEDGKGKTKMGEKLGVKDYTDAKVQEKMKDEEMTKAIKEGVTKEDKKVMKSFAETLSDDEIKALVKYVRDFKK